MTVALLDHLWQSTLVAALAALLALSLRNNSARVRFWLWFAASIKFLIPFAALSALGERLAALLPVTVTASPRLLAMAPAAETISAPATMLASAPGAPAGVSIALVLGLVWALGFAAVLGVRLIRSLRLRSVLKDARDIDLSAVPPFVKVKTSSSLLEPGLVGIFNPVVLLPQGLMTRLSHSEIQSILAHELTHLRRRDNLTAAIHMWVEALFWFYPLVWLIGARLIAERERACDEGVLAHGHDREVYAGGILKVCKFCLQSPLACASGVSGGDLGTRVRQIMTAPDAVAVPAPKKMLLASAALLTLTMPVMAGLVSAPIPAAIHDVGRSVAAAADTALAHGLAALGALPAPAAPQPLPRLEMAKLPAPVAELPDFTVADWQPQNAPAVAALPRQQPVPVAAAPAPLKSATAPVVNAVQASTGAAWASNPRGEGNPDAITCRTPQLLPGSRLRGPHVCQPNKVWAQLAANHQIVLPDGKTIVATNLKSEACGVTRLAGLAVSAGSTPGTSTRTSYNCN